MFLRHLRQRPCFAEEAGDAFVVLRILAFGIGDDPLRNQVGNLYRPPGGQRMTWMDRQSQRVTVKLYELESPKARGPGIDHERNAQRVPVQSLDHLLG